MFLPTSQLVHVNELQYRLELLYSLISLNLLHTMPSDLDTLVDMGFEKQRAQLAVSKSGGLQGALEWLEKYQDKPLSEITANENKAETDPNVTLLVVELGPHCLR